jgi:hypothetical protein
MAIALRPRRSASMISSRYGSHALALGARPGRGIAPTSADTSVLVAAFGESKSVDTGSEIAGFDCPESVDTSHGEIAGFALDSLGRPRPRTGSPAAFRSPLTVSRRTPVVCWMRESVQPRRPSARICCRVVSPKTLLMPATEPAFCARVNVSAVSVNCRF